MTELLGWVCLCGGLFGLAAAHLRWYESEFWVVDGLVRHSLRARREPLSSLKAIGAACRLTSAGSRRRGNSKGNIGLSAGRAVAAADAVR